MPEMIGEYAINGTGALEVDGVCYLRADYHIEIQQVADNVSRAIGQLTLPAGTERGAFEALEGGTACLRLNGRHPVEIVPTRVRVGEIATPLEFYVVGPVASFRC